MRWSVCGQPRELGDNMGVVAYRVAQEALTNAHKHGVDEAVSPSPTNRKWSYSRRRIGCVGPSQRRTPTAMG